MRGNRLTPRPPFSIGQFANKVQTQHIGFMFSQVNGGLSNGYLARNNIDPTAGVRFKF